VKGWQDDSEAARLVWGRHNAYAVRSILTWNFRHIVNDATKGKVKVVNAVSRYNEIGIVSPDDFLMGGH
jgi:hypothetical protein